jgi:predicted component of type VI protein secretion system
MRTHNALGLSKTALLASVCLLGLFLVGCGTRYSTKPPVEFWSDMARQPKVKAQKPNDFFANNIGSRRPVPGTIAVGYLKDDDSFFTGQRDGYYINNPLPLNKDLLIRGQERYDIYCAPCHDRTGSGRGIVSIRSQGWIANSLLDERIQEYPDGHLFHVISNGVRSMPGYRWQIEEKDRWAIVAYMRVLQRASIGTIEDVPADLRSDLR